jgi:hypothetical protein
LPVDLVRVARLLGQQATSNSRCSSILQTVSPRQPVLLGVPAWLAVGWRTGVISAHPGDGPFEARNLIEVVVKRHTADGMNG